MTIENNDPLADLGLDLGDSTAAVTEQPATDTAPAEPKQKREEVEIGELEFGEADFLPALKRGGEKGSKYDFDGLGAPVAKEDGSGFRYKFFTVRRLPDVDLDKLKRSVQSATTAANRAEKEAGSGKYFATRSYVENGEQVGIRVFRVDNTVKTEE